MLCRKNKHTLSRSSSTPILLLYVLGINLCACTTEVGKKHEEEYRPLPGNEQPGKEKASHKEAQISRAYVLLAKGKTSEEVRRAVTGLTQEELQEAEKRIRLHEADKQAKLATHRKSVRQITKNSEENQKLWKQVLEANPQIEIAYNLLLNQHLTRAEIIETVGLSEEDMKYVEDRIAEEAECKQHMRNLAQELYRLGEPRKEIMQLIQSLTEEEMQAIEASEQRS
jgi:hypothetical protein